MFMAVQATIRKETSVGTYLNILAPGVSLINELKKHAVDKPLTGELRLDDGRTISGEQRKKAYATLRDIMVYTGDYPLEATKEDMKALFYARSGCDAFSLSDCSMTTARLFINHLIDFAFEWEIPLMDTVINRTDDINAAVFASLKHKRCILCNSPGETHHWDAIGRGYDRTTYDDNHLRKICLCRKHHTEAHQIGRAEFEERYHVYGIIYNEKG